jgi:hypothetical protein
MCACMRACMYVLKFVCMCVCMLINKYVYRFNGVVRDAKASQEKVFKKVGTVAILNGIDGFNSTVLLTYGQTGSIITYTHTVYILLTFE